MIINEIQIFNDRLNYYFNLKIYDNLYCECYYDHHLLVGQVIEMQSEHIIILWGDINNSKIKKYVKDNNSNYYTAQIDSNIPENWHPKKYKDLNPDLDHINNAKDLLNHYILYGIKENRIFREEQNLPNDFDPKVYRILNYDLYNYNDDELKKHYILHGVKENRQYKNDLIHIHTAVIDTEYLKHRPVFINHDCSLTGAPIFLNDLVLYLKINANINPLIIDPYPSKLFDSYNIDRIYHFNDPLVLKKLLLDIDPKFIYSNSINLLYTNLELFNEFFHKTLFHFHEIIDHANPKRIKKILNQKIFVVSDKIKTQFESIGCSNVSIFPPFLSADKIAKIKSSPKAHSISNVFRNLDKNKIIIGMSGQICHRKNFALFYNTALANPDKEFIWVGGDNWRADANKIYEQRFEHLDNFFHVPYTSNPYGYYKLFDCFFLTSLSDPCPIVVLENLLLNKTVLVLKNNIFYSHDQKSLTNYIAIDNTNKNEKYLIKEISSKFKKSNKNYSGEQYIIKEFSENKLNKIIQDSIMYLSK